MTRCLSNPVGLFNSMGKLPNFQNILGCDPVVKVPPGRLWNLPKMIWTDKYIALTQKYMYLINPPKNQKRLNYLQVLKMSDEIFH